MREEELLKMLSDLWTYYEVGDQTLKKDRKLFAAPTDVQYEINLKDHDECIVGKRLRDVIVCLNTKQ